MTIQPMVLCSWHALYSPGESSLMAPGDGLTVQHSCCQKCLNRLLGEIDDQKVAK